MAVDPFKTDKLLIIDHNMLRFHQYDLMESMLYHKPFFNRLKDEYKSYLTLSANKQVEFLKNVNSERFVTSFFLGSNNTPEEYSEILNGIINYSGKYTLMDIYYGLISLSNMSLVNITILQYSGDVLYDTDINNKTVDIIKSENILDISFIKDIIRKKDIHTVLCDSIDMALEISNGLRDISFIIPDYRYNVDDYNGIKAFKSLDKITTSGLESGHNYTMFNNFKLRRDEV